MRSTLTKPHSFATVSIGKSACSSVQQPRRSLSGVAAKKPREIARAHGHAIRKGGTLRSSPACPRIQATGIAPGAPEKNHHRLGYEQRDRDLLQPRQGQDQSRVDYARCCGRQNRRDKLMPAPHQRRYRTHHSTRVWSVQACRHLWGECRPWPPGGKSFFLAPIPVLSR